MTTTPTSPADRLAETLKFYRDEAWTLAQDGDPETGQVVEQWLDVTPALLDDQGRRAAEALQAYDASMPIRLTPTDTCASMFVMGQVAPKENRHDD